MPKNYKYILYDANNAANKHTDELFNAKSTTKAGREKSKGMTKNTTNICI